MEGSLQLALADGGKDKERSHPLKAELTTAYIKVRPLRWCLGYFDRGRDALIGVRATRHLGVTERSNNVELVPLRQMRFKALISMVQRSYPRASY
ncbi:hypothetical protein EC968_003866 [Mortierella alpina]|nr:hypothetical protein EC968_003866 [Mortierella alpina]